MKRLASIAALAGLAGACTDDSADYPIRPQDDFQVTPGGQPVIGRVCVASDLRDLVTCSDDAAGGLTVQLGTMEATTAADGTFAFPTPTERVSAFTVSGTGAGGIEVVPTTSPFAVNAFVPAIDADLWARTMTSNGILLDPGQGSILAAVTRDGQPISGISVTSQPVSAFGPFYDASSPVLWGLGGTATRGMVLVPGLTAGMVDLSFNNALGGLETNVAGVTVRNGGVTVLDTVLPGTIP
jgi:hypothetical protein